MRRLPQQDEMGTDETLLVAHEARHAAQETRIGPGQSRPTPGHMRREDVRRRDKHATRDLNRQQEMDMGLNEVSVGPQIAAQRPQMDKIQTRIARVGTQEATTGNTTL